MPEQTTARALMGTRRSYRFAPGAHNRMGGPGWPGPKDSGFLYRSFIIVSAGARPLGPASGDRRAQPPGRFRDYTRDMNALLLVAALASAAQTAPAAPSGKVLFVDQENGVY